VFLTARRDEGELEAVDFEVVRTEATAGNLR